MELVTSAVLCLALNIYNEARGEPLEGQYAVAQVVLNRVNSNKWPDTVCKVVYQPYQFSWTFKQFTLSEAAALDRATKIAEDVLVYGINTSSVVCADHYHNFTVNPHWAQTMEQEVTIGNHIFYCSGDAWK